MALRDVRPADLPIFFEHQRQPDANRMAAFPPRHRDAFMQHWRARVLGNPENIAKTIVIEGSVAGNIGSWSQEGRRLVGYWIDQDHWGRGVATAALAEFVTRHELTRPLHAYVAVHNVGSIRVLEKCGFRPVSEPFPGSDGIEELLMELDASP